MKRVSLFLYGVAVYALFLGVFVYACGFVGNFLVPKSIDSAQQAPRLEAVLVDVLLLGIFALQHSVMARQGFKRWLTNFVPAPIERSTYVLFSSLALILLFVEWEPIGGVIWDVQAKGPRIALYGLFAFGWLLVLATTYMINHFDLFGLRQVWLQLIGHDYEQLPFVTPGPYKLVRHPLYVGWLFAFWFTPRMTIAHLIFALLTTGYILIAIRLEERDLLQFHGDRYARYQHRVPMLVPRVRKSSG
jgi:protein-S-isoprenylcysteine O-methyltransferase Ste14